jgi:DnaJ-class molecular chaperone
VEDIYHGKVVEASFQKQTACKKCHGTGAESPKSLNVCSKCGGNGFSIVEGMNYFGQKFVNENTCQACQGWGKQISKPCPVCGGKKIVTRI